MLAFGRNKVQVLMFVETHSLWVGTHRVNSGCRSQSQISNIETRILWDSIGGSMLIIDSTPPKLLKSEILLDSWDTV